jgi:hypothetical protein
LKVLLNLALEPSMLVSDLSNYCNKLLALSPELHELSSLRLVESILSQHLVLFNETAVCELGLSELSPELNKLLCSFNSLGSQSALVIVC